MPLTISKVATAADVNIQTIRYYERRGLIPTPRRTPAGYRQYAEEAVARLRFIKHAQELGFSLQEIQELLGLRVRHGAACDTVERKTRQKIEVVQQKIRDFQRMKRTLERLAAALGLSGAGLAATFEPLRPYFVGGTMLALGSGFVVLHREEKRACEPGTLCASPIVRRRMKWALRVATIVSIPLLTFPWWSKLVLG